MAPSQPQKRACSPSPNPNTSKKARLDSRSYETSFLIISDTHDAETNYPQCDVLLHCGDLTENGSPTSLRNALRSIGKAEAELKLVIAGNHEISLDEDYYVGEGGSREDCDKASAMVSTDPDSEASKNGIIFLSEGTHTFTLRSGATLKIYASPYTPAYGESAFQYATAEDRFNPPGWTPDWARNTGTEASIIPPDVDIIMTHGPPKYLLDRTSENSSAGCEHLRRALGRVRPRLHCFGHVHSGYGALRVAYDDNKVKERIDCLDVIAKEWVGKNQARRRGFATLSPGSMEAFREDQQQTLVVNAAIQTGEDGEGNMPWLVKLDLPSSGVRRTKD